MKNLLNLKDAKILSKKEQKNVFGGQFYLGGGTVNCYCNGTPLGTAADALGCAAKCQQCVSNGGCPE